MRRVKWSHRRYSWLTMTGWYILADYGWHTMADGGGTFTGDY